MKMKDGSNECSSDQAQRIMEEERQKRMAQSKTVIIENLSLDLGITQKDVFRYLKERLYTLGERGDLDIVDIDMNPFKNKVNNNSISV